MLKILRLHDVYALPGMISFANSDLDCPESFSSSAIAHFTCKNSNHQDDKLRLSSKLFEFILLIFRSFKIESKLTKSLLN